MYIKHVDRERSICIYITLYNTCCAHKGWKVVMSCYTSGCGHMRGVVSAYESSDHSSESRLDSPPVRRGRSGRGKRGREGRGGEGEREGGREGGRERREREREREKRERERRESHLRQHQYLH